MNEKTFARLLLDLNSEDYAKVEEAANTISALRDSNALPLILSALETGSPLIKRVMLWALQNYPSLDYSLFVSYLSSPDSDVSEAAQVLFMVGKEKSVDVLSQVLHSSADEKLICSVVETLGQYREEYVCSPLISALTSPFPSVREVAAYALAFYRTPAVTEGLFSLLSDVTPVVHAALTALRHRSLDENRINLILPLLMHEESAVRVAAVHVLDAHVPDSAADDADSKVRRAVAETTANVDVIKKLCRDSDSSVRMAAVDNLQKLGINMDEMFISLLKDENPGVRRAAASALGNSSGDTVISALIEALSDVKPGVCATVASSLGKIGGEEAISALKKYENNRNPILSGIIKNALSEALKK